MSILGEVTCNTCGFSVGIVPDVGLLPGRPCPKCGGLLERTASPFGEAPAATQDPRAQAWGARSAACRPDRRREKLRELDYEPLRYCERKWRPEPSSVQWGGS